MSDLQTLAIGDDCPACGDELRAALVPSEEQYRKAFDRENPITLPPSADTATAAQRADLGTLYRCRRCGYQTRFKTAAGDETGARGAARSAGKKSAA